MNQEQLLGALKTLKQYLAAQCSGDIVAMDVVRNQLTIVVKKDSIANFLTFLRDDSDCQFRQLMDICGVDCSELKDACWRVTEGFAVVYHLLSLTKNLRIRVKTYVKEGETLPTATTVFSAAGWYERETYDLYGITFENHPDLRRILTDYEFDGHPLRKDFPLIGKVETYFDENQQRVAYKPVDLPQEFRQFNQQSPWQGMTGNSHLAEEDQNSVFDETEFKT